MAFMVHHLKSDDFDTFKSMFDADPVGRKQAAKGHVMLRSVDNPNGSSHGWSSTRSRTRTRSQNASWPPVRSTG